MEEEKIQNWNELWEFEASKITGHNNAQKKLLNYADQRKPIKFTNK